MNIFDSLHRKAQEAELKMNASIKLANAIKNQGTPDIDDAIRDLSKLLDLYTSDKNWFKWAETQNNLGVAYMYKFNGEISDNVEKGISHWMESLKFFTRDNYPYQWGQLQTNIGGAYLQIGKSGDRSVNLEKCIKHINLALEILRYEDAPKDWSRAHNSLAVAYFYRITGNRSENIEISINHYHLALKGRVFNEAPIEWAMSKSNLGGAYLARIKGESAENIEEAIKFLNESLVIRTEDELPTYWAETQALLGTAYATRKFGDSEKNLQSAISCYENSLKIYSREKDITRWAEVQENLAITYKDLSRINNPADNINNSLRCLELALQHPEKNFEHWVSAKINLGDIYRSRFSITNDKNDLLNAEASYLQVLDRITQNERPQYWASAHGGLGETYLALRDIENAITNYKLALEVFSPENFPEKSFQTSEEVGHLCYLKRDFNTARHFYTIAHQSIENIRSEIKREKFKRELAGENVRLYERLVYCCLLEGDVHSALEYVFAAKSRIFLDQLSSTRLDLSTMMANNSAFASNLEEVRALRNQIDNLLGTILNNRNGQGATQQSDIRTNILEEVAQLKDQEEKLWSELEQKHPALTATQIAPKVSAHDAMALAEELNVTIIEYYQHSEGWCAFLITPHNITVFPLEELSNSFAQSMMRWVNGLETPAGKSPISYKALKNIYRILIAPLRKQLALNRLVLAPFGFLHLFPFAAALNEDTNRYLIEDFVLSFTPSTAALYISKRQSEIHSTKISQKQRGTLLSVAYSGPVGSDLYLPNVLPEAKAIQKHFSKVTFLYENNATPDAVIANVEGKQMIHFGCHGSFDTEHPQQSGLILADGWLTAQRIVFELRLKETEIVTLGSCLSGSLDVTRGDEIIGLTQSMLTAGAKSVAGSLWSVDDIATRVLFETFYSHVAVGESPAVAMQNAMQNVRKETNWAHPYYWAAFSISGLAH